MTPAERAEAAWERDPRPCTDEAAVDLASVLYPIGTEEGAVRAA